MKHYIFQKPTKPYLKDRESVESQDLETLLFSARHEKDFQKVLHCINDIKVGLVNLILEKGDELELDPVEFDHLCTSFERMGIVQYDEEPEPNMGYENRQKLYRDNANCKVYEFRKPVMKSPVPEKIVPDFDPTKVV